MEGGASTNTFGKSKKLKLVVMHQIDPRYLSELFDEPLPPAAVYGDQHPPSRITRERFQNVFQNCVVRLLPNFFGCFSKKVQFHGAGEIAAQRVSVRVYRGRLVNDRPRNSLQAIQDADQPCLDETIRLGCPKFHGCHAAHRDDDHVRAPA